MNGVGLAKSCDSRKKFGRLLHFCHMQLGCCRLVLISTRAEDLCLGKKVPWQLVALIEDHKCMEVEVHEWYIYVVHRALATLASKSFVDIFLGLVTQLLAHSSDIIVCIKQKKLSLHLVVTNICLWHHVCMQSLTFF